MGKASRKLKEAVNEIYREPKEDNDECSSSTEDSNNVSLRTVDIAEEIRHAIFKYVDEGGYPLCEYLDSRTVENYVSHGLFPPK